MMTTPTFAAPMRADQTELGVAILEDVKHIVTQAEANAPRSQQKAIGPSEYGTPCARRLAYKMMDHPPTNAQQDPWARIVGTAVHKWLEGIFGNWPEQMPDGRRRYVVEQRVSPHLGLEGSADLFDRKLAVVIDWKIPGLTAVRKARKEGVSTVYRNQAHAYGVGFTNAGEHVEHVAIVMIPKAGVLNDAYVWTEALDPTVVTAAAARQAAVLDMVCKLDVEQHPARYALIPAAEAYCAWCPFHLPGGNGADGCPGPQPITTGANS